MAKVISAYSIFKEAADLSASSSEGHSIASLLVSECIKQKIEQYFTTVADHDIPAGCEIT